MRRLLDRVGVERSGLMLVLLPLATGIALVVHIVADVSLALAAGGLVLLGGALLWVYWRHQPVPVRRRLRRQLGYGALAGLIATAFYDLTRVVVSATATPRVNPFEAWPIFGQLLTGAPRESVLAAGVGFGYHLANGLGFAVAYVLLFRRPGLVTGVVWALGLQLFMALLYPSWLRIEALGEFLTVSIIGHAAYGAALGVAAARFQPRIHAASGGGAA